MDQGIHLTGTFYVDKYRDGESEPYESIVVGDNLLTYGGASALWEQLKGTGSVTAFDNANAYLGVGDSTTAAATTQTDLQASSNKLRVAMDATFPTHTDGTGSASNAVITYTSTFITSAANYAWNEFALFNASTSGRMFNRKVQSVGTKTSADAWVLTLTLTAG